MIYTRIDTYSVILYNVSIIEVLLHFNVPSSEFEKIYSNGYKSSQVQMGDTFCFSHRGMRIDCKLDEYKRINHDPKISALECKFSWVRFYLSSEGVDYVESLNPDPDFSLQIAFSDPCFYETLTQDYHVTRCDFAFDFVNYEGNEFERLRKILVNAEFNEDLSHNGRLYTGNPGGISYRVSCGKAKTIYFGAETSQRMLRIYDKKYQLFDPETNQFDSEKIPRSILDNEKKIFSWYRVELQTREDFAFRYLMSSGGDFKYIMGEIASYFDVRKKDGKTIAPLHKIFLWTERTTIIQNAKSAQPRKQIDVIAAYIKYVVLRKLHLMAVVWGPSRFMRFINDSVKERAQSDNPKKRARYKDKFNAELNDILREEGIRLSADGSTPYAYLGDDGFYYLYEDPNFVGEELNALAT